MAPGSFWSRVALPMLLSVGFIGGWSVACRAGRPPTPRMTPRRVMESLFSALEGEDRAAYERLTTSGFRAFEGGRILDRDGFFDLVMQAHREGRTLRWSVTDERVALGGKVAVMDYVNTGATGDAAMAWLEVAAFRLTPNGWAIDFVESQRVQSPPSMS